jgi:hypothetical protein
MYVRLAVFEKDSDSNQEMGLFSAMGKLHETNELYEYELDIENEIYKWFKRNLKVPKVQADTSNHYRVPMAISWFKSSAKEHISKMRAYGQILEQHDYIVKQLITDRPGKIVYEDDHQIAAIPFVDTF